MIHAGVAHRGYSKPLRRRIVDFGSDVAFGQVNKKLREHYGIEAPVSSIRKITLEHAGLIKARQDKELCKCSQAEKASIISETDGSMIPIVKPGKDGDKRKQKKTIYREGRLTLAHEKGSKSPVFSATLGDVKETGKHMLHCVQRVGLGKKTKIHCVGDGATWIESQIEEHFGLQATYLVDFYHVCDYLSAASSICAPNQEKSWMDKQKQRLKSNQIQKVLESLRVHLEAPDIPDDEAFVRACYRYLSNRLNQLDYKTALDNALPIGSGEIESAHRYVVQQRLKIQGAWWLEKSAANMLALRVNRVNDDWEGYWKNAA